MYKPKYRVKFIWGCDGTWVWRIYHGDKRRLKHICESDPYISKPNAARAFRKVFSPEIAEEISESYAKLKRGE